MKESYDDITLRIVEKPSWWDQDGVPRYGEHSPYKCPDIYADEVVLLKITCQSCQREFLVQMHWGKLDRSRCVIQLQAECYRSSKKMDESYKPPFLRDMIADGSIHYGDPPIHYNQNMVVSEGGSTVEFSCIGNSMNCEDLEVQEYWSRLPYPHEEGKCKFPDWARDAKWEVKLPDANQDQETVF